MKDTQATSLLRHIYFLLLVLILTAGMVYLFAPFVAVIVLSLVLVEFFYPVYKKIYKVFKNKWSSSIVCTLLAILVVVIPIISILVLAASEALNLGVKLQVFLSDSGVLNGNSQELFKRLDEFLAHYNLNSEIIRNNWNNLLLQLGGQLGQFMYATISTVINNITNLIIGGFLMIFTLIFLFADYDTLQDKIKRISILPDDLDTIFFEKFNSTAKAVIKGSFIIALLQASAVAIILYVMQIEGLILWWIVMVLFSIIPVGSGVVWFPVGITLILIGRPVEGFFLIIVSAVSINLIDTIFRPLLIKGDTNLHPLVALFSALGGLSAFGLMGLLYGPLIAVFFITVMQVYRERYNTNGDH